MILDQVFHRFVDKRPIPVMARVVLERVLTPERLDEWFGRTTQRQYTRELLFSSLVNVMSLVAFKAFPSIHAAYQTVSDEIGVSVTSVYNKLNGVEPRTSGALVRDTAREFAQVVEDVNGCRRAWLPGYRVKVLDGNCIAATEHRLAVLRDTSAGPLPGKSLVVYDPSVEMAIDLFPCEDGHAQERALLGEVLSTVQPGDLWIMDRNFCVCAFLTGIKTRQAQFICRQHLGFAFTPQGPERVIGNSETGRVYEQWIEVVPPDGGDAHRYRRI